MGSKRGDVPEEYGHVRERALKLACLFYEAWLGL
jgi:hypothetical protein